MNTASILIFSILLVVAIREGCAKLVPTNTDGPAQIQRLKAAGYDPSNLDHSTQLRLFLYTWLSMERLEQG